MTAWLAPAAMAQSAPEPTERPDPTEIPIGTEAGALTERPLELVRRRPLPTSMSFRIATWNLTAKRPGEITTGKNEITKRPKQWRHTFGAERKTAQWRSLGRRDFSADIIALQGVGGRRTVAHLFNARRYHIIVSRQLLARSAATGTGFSIFREDAPPTTALVYRRRRGVRIAGFRHFMPKPVSQPQQETPAITAIRLRVYRKVVWVASADIPADCPADMSGEQCQAHQTIIDAFVTWAGKHVTRQKAPLLLMGRWPDAVITKLSEAGLPLRRRLSASNACSPAPSDVLLVSAPSVSDDAAVLANPEVVKSNDCVSTVELTINLVD